MTPILIAIIVVVLLLIFLLLGFPIGVSLATVSLLGIYLTLGKWTTGFNLIGSTAYSALRSYSFAVIPLFVIMGLFANEAGSGREVYNAAALILRKIRGGLAMATIVANAIFAAITGASIASAAVFSKISYPEMVRHGYEKKTAVGVIAGSSVLGMLIPPSILMIVYGGIAQVSIGKLFFGGVGPGIVLAVIYCILVLGLCFTKNIDRSGRPDDYVEEEEDYIKHPAQTLLKPLTFVLLIVILFGGMWGGLFTPTEAGGVGACCCLILLIAKGKFTFRTLWNALLETGRTSGSILFLLICAQMFSRMLAISGIVTVVGNAIVSLQVAPRVIIFALCLIQIFLGCILDSTSIILLTTPIALPVITALGFDPLWYGVVMIIAVEMGLITPPFGISVFTVKSSLDNMQGIDELGGAPSVGAIFAGSAPFIIGMVVVLVICIFVPDLITWLPNSMVQSVTAG